MTRTSALGIAAAVLTLTACGSGGSGGSASSTSSATSPPGAATPTPAPTGGASAAPTPAPLPAVPVPRGFQIDDLTFAGGRSFALGFATDVDHVMLAASDDSGASWQLIGALPPLLCPGPAACVYNLRFGSTGTGYAWGPGGLLVTHDGGRTWSRRSLPPVGGSSTILDLAAYGDRAAVAIVGEGPCGCDVEYTSDGGSTWHDSGFSPPTAANSRDVVSMQAGIVYAAALGNPAGGGSGSAPVAVSTDGGRSWATRANPCSGGDLNGDLQTAGSGVVVVECLHRASEPWTSTLAISTDSAVTFSAHSSPVSANSSAITFTAMAAASAHRLGIVRPQDSGGLQISADGGQHWHSVLGCSPIWFGFESATEAHAMCGANQVSRSFDGGESWQTYTFPG